MDNAHHMAKGRSHRALQVVGPRKGVVAIDTTSGAEDSREASLGRWLKRTQEVLAYRSLQGRAFHRLYNLLRTKRLVEIALAHVLENEGSKTAGIDGVTRKDLKAEDGARAKLIDDIWKGLCSKEYRPKPVRRVYIPKANGDRRPLGIPTIKDRVVQEMLRLILEPIYEGRFYGHSYGFRPFRSTHHAAVRIKDLIGRREYNWAVEGDIRKCFDRIHHAKLLGILRRTIKDERIIHLVRQMLSAGVMEDGAWHVTDEGTPQGGIVSPLLANIYLNELDQFVAGKWAVLTNHERRKRRKHGTALPCFLVRYADDFVVMVSGTEQQARQLKAAIAEFLRSELQLELSEEKTLVTPVEKGLDFLGFHIRKHQGTTLIKPSRKAMARFRRTVKQRAWEGFSDNDAAGIVHVNQYVIGWGMYYRWVSSARDFRRLDHYVWERVWRTTYRLRGGKATRAQHLRQHSVAYRFDLNKKNRWRRGGHFGAWADREHTRAQIVVRLAFIPIRYADFHPQWNPYVPAERKLLEAKRELTKLLAEVRQNGPKVNRTYGAEWNVIRLVVLRDAGWQCERCGHPIGGHEAHVHHKRKLKSAKNRQMAHVLENLEALCPSCHSLVERDETAAV